MYNQPSCFRRLSRAVLLGWWLTLACGNSANAAGWPDELQDGRFFCHANFQLAPYRETLREIPALQGELARILGVRPNNQPIHLFLFSHKNIYKSYLRKHFPKAPYRQALFIKEGPRGPGMVFTCLGKDFENDLRHESVHAILNASLPAVPLWLDEGLAEYFEMPARQRASEHPHLGRIRLDAWLKRRPDLQELEALQDVSRMGNGEYRGAWAWVHFMLHGPPEARDELQRFLFDLQSRTPTGPLSRRLYARIDDLDKRFTEHFRKWK